MHRFALLSSAVLALALCGCQTTKHTPPDQTIKTSSIKTEESTAGFPKPANLAFGETHHLAGRVLTISSLKELKLQPKEVILSFDDGPIPGRTEHVLATLERFGVKGAFMMVGEMADLHPELARRVAMEGNTIGSHTYKHPNLDTLSFDMAMAEIARGEAAVTKATGTDVNFFRFPYLADSRKLRSAVAMRDMVVMDVDVDTKDYFTSTPEQVADRAMTRLHQRGSGIILMHDIHKRTAAMLPTLLSRLEAEGYKVVTLKYRKPPKTLEMASL
jgi:peptidoglycan-N-acetylglucosamine deacetylase